MDQATFWDRLRGMKNPVILGVNRQGMRILVDFPDDAFENPKLPPEYIEALRKERAE